MRMWQTFKAGLWQSFAIVVIGLVAVSSVGIADQEPIETGNVDESAGTPVFQSDTATETVVEVMKDSVFRIDRKDDQGIWTHHGTGFAVELTQGQQRLFVATNAHVVEKNLILFEKETKLFEANELTAVQSGNGLRYQVVKILTHPGRRDLAGPDVAVLELQSIGRANARPKGFRVLPTQWKQRLEGKSVALMGFPAIPEVDKQKLFVTRGDINQEQDEWLLYTLVTQGGASGSPVFLVQVERDPGSGDWFAQEYVAAVHSQRTSQPIKRGVPVRWLWQLFDHHKIPVANINRRVPEILKVAPAEKPKPAKDGEGFVVVPQRPKVTPDDERDNEWETASELVEKGEAVKAHEAIEKVRRRFEDQQSPVPWEVDCLAGVNRSRNAEAHFRVGRIDVSHDEYRQAMAAFKTAEGKKPTSRLPTLLWARAAHNAATIHPSNVPDRALLKTSHDAVEWLREKAPLTLREKAQAFYVLALTHRFLDCGKDNDGVRKKPHDEFLQSFRFLPSRQSADWHMRMHEPAKAPQVDPKLPDLWDEVTTLKSAWNNRYAKRTL